MGNGSGRCRQPVSCECRGRRHERRDPPVPRQCPRGRSRRSSPPRARDTVARPGDGRGSIAGRAVGQAQGDRALLGDGVRLAQGRGEAERPAAVRDHDRRPRHPFHSCPLAPSECAAADHHPWLAGLDHRASEGHRSAHRSDRPWRTRGGRLRPRDPVDSRLRLLRQANGRRLEPRSHRASLGGADEAPRLRQLRRTGRRLGRPHHQRDGASEACGVARHSRQPAGDRAGRRGRGARRRWPRPARSLRHGTRGVRRARASSTRSTEPTPR